MDNFLNKTYKVVAKSKTAQVLGGVGAKGDVVERVVIVPETTGAGTVALIDGTGAGAVSVNLFVTGTLTDLHPIVIELGARSVVGKWQITTGDNVHVIAIGQFS